MDHGPDPAGQRWVLGGTVTAPGSWVRSVGDRVVDAADAAALVRPGDRITIAMGSVWMSPTRTVRAIIDRLPSLGAVTVDSTFSLFGPLGGYQAAGAGLETESFFVVPKSERQRLTDRSPDANYISLHPHLIGTKAGDRHRDDFTRRFTAPDVCVIAVSEPDADGQVTFGHQVWMARAQAARARTVIAEVIEGLPVVPGGDNSFPLSRFDAIVPGDRAGFFGTTEPVAVEDREATDECGRNVAALIDDGDTVMFGGGQMPMRMGPYLADKVDLGCHTELVCPLELVEGGVINGRRRNVDPGKVTATALLPTSEHEWSWIDGNTAFELRDMWTNNDPRRIAANDNLVAINAPAEISLWGEIGVERVGSRYLGGIGGQIEFVLGALMSRGGRSIHAVLSTKVDSTTGERVSAITPELRAPGVATVPRHLADFVVTEHGVASLLGKTERERAAALIDIAHPDYREELRHAAAHLFGVGRHTTLLGGSVA